MCLLLIFPLTTLCGSFYFPILQNHSSSRLTLEVGDRRWSIDLPIPSLNDGVFNSRIHIERKREKKSINAVRLETSSPWCFPVDLGTVFCTIGTKSAICHWPFKKYETLKSITDTWFDWFIIDWDRYSRVEIFKN